MQARRRLVRPEFQVPQVPGFGVETARRPGVRSEISRPDVPPVVASDGGVARFRTGFRIVANRGGE